MNRFGQLSSKKFYHPILKPAQGNDDLSAIEKAAKQFSLNIDGSKDEGASNFENNGIDYYNILNQIHLKTRKEFKSSCLLSNEEDRRSLFLCKCQLGEFISYGLDESIVFSQNAAAFGQSIRASQPSTIDHALSIC